ncbi:DUF1961 family protein [Pseudactinotalea sp. Z1739]|uniref:DUF1961 family protein n=1 Tax=Pseudactinotalea sp. Z1739 TaxID=3413028 RepID=UPI003C7CB7E9
MPSTYRNRLASAADLDRFVLEGDGALSFPRGRLRLESLRDPGEGQDANIVLWCPQPFGAEVEISFDFYPLADEGLCILFFHATGHDGRNVLDPALAPRTGPYQQYHHGDLDAYHVSYFRRKWDTERRFHTANLRKSHGFHLVAQGADPLPPLADADPPYRISVRTRRDRVRFAIDDLPIFDWHDDGGTGGDPLRGGHLGFRQMAPMIAEYADLTVRPL